MIYCPIEMSLIVGKPMEIKILGPGCSNCEKLAADAKLAAKESGCAAEVVKVTDMKQLMTYGILSTPGPIISGKVKSYGRIPSVSEIKKWIKEEK
jgi:small redox-active disulfide protein 2